MTMVIIQLIRDGAAIIFTATNAGRLIGILALFTTPYLAASTLPSMVPPSNYQGSCRDGSACTPQQIANSYCQYWTNQNSIGFSFTYYVSYISETMYCVGPSTYPADAPLFPTSTSASCPTGYSLSTDGSVCNLIPCSSNQVRNNQTNQCDTFPLCTTATTSCTEASSSTVIPNKNLGNTISSCPTNSSNRILFGNPINIGTGNKYQLETDYQGSGDFPLVYERFYNSDISTVSDGFGSGNGWRHSYSRSIDTSINSNVVVAYRPDSRAYMFSLFGGKWLSVSDVNLKLSGSTTTGWQLTAEDGSVENYNAGGKLQSIKSRGGATHTLAYGTNGLLSTITHSNGRSLSLTYDTALRVSTLKDPAGNLYLYGYNATTGNLETVTYPDGDIIATNNPIRTYVYNEPANVGADFPHGLTGIIDENKKRFATFQYDAQQRAITTQHWANSTQQAGYIGVSYGTTSNDVTDALNTTRTYRFQTIQGVVKNAGSDQPAGAGCGASANNFGYDANGNIASRIDFNGNLSCYAYDTARNLETTRVEGLAPGSTCPADVAAYTLTPQSNERKISTQWHPIYRLPSQIDRAGQRINFTYDTAGNLTQKTITDTVTLQTRSWIYTYNTNGQILTEDGPLTGASDKTTYVYYTTSTTTYKPGDLKTITNALGHVTTFTSYDANGRLLSLTDPNALVIGFGYDRRGRLTQKTVDGNTTLYGYDLAGNLTSITRPSGVIITYLYDDAHRLTDIIDATSAKIHYTLDPMGNRTKEEIFDATATLVKTHSRKFDALSRLQQDIDAYNQATLYEYDANGNLKQITDANGNITKKGYDTLNRVAQITDATTTGITDYFYDDQDRITQVTDAANHSTNYIYNGLGDLKQITSPDTGITQFNYDSAGNLYQKTDANLNVSIYKYDLLNRLTGIDYPGTDADIVNTYDEVPSFGQGFGISTKVGVGIGSNLGAGIGGGITTQKGRLTTAQRGTQITKYIFDKRGNIRTVTGQTPEPATTCKMPYTSPFQAASVLFFYNPDDQLVYIWNDTRRAVQFFHDNTGNVYNIQVTDLVNTSSTNKTCTTRTRSLANMAHLPFGPVSRTYYGNGIVSNRIYDLNYSLTEQHVGLNSNVQNLSYGYYPNGNLHTVTDLNAVTNNQIYQYDPLNQLNTVSGNNNLSYNYDAVGNRTFDALNAAGTIYNYDTNSQILQNQTGARPDTLNNDKVGNITLSAGKTFGYGPDNLLNSVQQSGISIATYKYNALRQRISKTTGAGTTTYNYDPQGQLIYENGPSLNASYVYLDSEPLARLDFNPNDPTGTVTNWNIAYYHNNLLGAPQVTTDQNGQINWAAQMDPFGKAQSINSTITQNLRLPGQYYDQETGLFYNMNRYYDPATGRYLQSDPIGLLGGINTYTYVGNNPLTRVDPLGLSWVDDVVHNVSNSEFYQNLLDKIRPPNPDYPPDQNITNYMQKYRNNPTLDCSEISEKIREYAGNGKILHVEPVVPGTLLVPIQNGYYPGYYHDVYTDGRYVYDPEFSATPIPKGDWTQIIKGLNPSVSITSR